MDATSINYMSMVGSKQTSMRALQEVKDYATITERNFYKIF